MQGTVLNIAGQGGQGVILGDDGSRYTYTLLGWRDSTVTAFPGMKVDFEIRGTHAVGVYPLPGQVPPAPAVAANMPYRNSPTIPTFPRQQPSTAVPSAPNAPVGSSQYAPAMPNGTASPALSKPLIGVIVGIAVLGIAMLVFFLIPGTDGWDFGGEEEVRATPVPPPSYSTDRNRDYSDDEDVRSTFSDATDRVRDFADDEDVRSTFGEATDRVREYAEDEDVQRTFSDAAEDVDRAIESIFGE